MTAWRAAAAGLAISLLATTQATAQGQTDFPNRRIHVIVPYPAGGIVDIVTRIMADKLSADWGQPIVVEPSPAPTPISPGAGRPRRAGRLHVDVLRPGTMANPRISRTSWNEKSFVGVGVVVWAPPAWWCTQLAGQDRDEFIALARKHARRAQLRQPGVGASHASEHGDLHQRHQMKIVACSYSGQPAGNPRSAVQPRAADGRLHRAGGQHIAAG